MGNMLYSLCFKTDYNKEIFLSFFLWFEFILDFIISKETYFVYDIHIQESIMLFNHCYIVYYFHIEYVISFWKTMKIYQNLGQRTGAFLQLFSTFGHSKVLVKKIKQLKLNGPNNN